MLVGICVLRVPQKLDHPKPREEESAVRTCQTSSADSESGSDMGSASGGGAAAAGGGSTGLTLGRTGNPARKAECTGAD